MARPKSGKIMLTRSYRIEERFYKAARARADREGTSVNQVISNLVEGYARGIYELPKIKTVTEFPKE